MSRPPALCWYQDGDEGINLEPGAYCLMERKDHGPTSAAIHRFRRGPFLNPDPDGPGGERDLTQRHRVSTESSRTVDAKCDHYIVCGWSMTDLYRLAREVREAARSHCLATGHPVTVTTESETRLRRHP